MTNSTTKCAAGKWRSPYWWVVQFVGLAGYAMLGMIDLKIMAGVFFVHVFNRLNGEFND